MNIVINGQIDTRYMTLGPNTYVGSEVTEKIEHVYLTPTTLFASRFDSMLKKKWTHHHATNHMNFKQNVCVCVCVCEGEALVCSVGRNEIGIVIVK